MFQFTDTLKARNETLFYFSTACLILAILFFALTKFSQIQVAGVNAWYKPLKFAISIGVYCSTMAWYCDYLPVFNIKFFNWANICLFSFELIYITIQAARGQESHFNQTTPLHRVLFAGMAVAAILITAYAAYVGIQFFQTGVVTLPVYYLWAIRLSIIIFIFFSLEGLAMGARQTHSIGGEVEQSFLPFFKWNMKQGDLRVAHFIGMHALQVIPLLSFYVLKNTKAVFALSGIYLLISLFILMQALQAQPFIRSKYVKHEIKG